jgi:hypothetical protein
VSNKAVPAPSATRGWAVPHLETASVALTLSLTMALALLTYYFIGYDQGAVSIFGADTHVHEFVHDARHFLGFPCH